MKKYDVYGMSCAACSARVERAVSSLDGVDLCTVSLLTNTMSVTGNISDGEIIDAVKRAGYSAKIQGDGSDAQMKKEHQRQERLTLQRRVISSAVLLIILMYFSMGHAMWNFPLPRFLDTNYISLASIQLVLSLAILIINIRFFINGTKSILALSPNMDALVFIGSGAAYIYSLWIFVQIIISPSHTLYHGLYFESGAMVLTLVTLGKLLEAVSKGRTTSALDSLINLAPSSATVIRDGKSIQIPVREMRIGDIFEVRSGEGIPCDGEVLDGESAVDESALSGESIPVDKSVGDRVSAGTTNTFGFIRCTATGVGEDTTLSKIIKTVRDASESRAPIARIADKISGIFVPTVIGIALISFIIWMLCGAEFSFALERAITVLVISCPCALGLATPVAIMVGSGVGAKNGILFKTAVALEALGRVDTVVLDKTGTLTTGKPIVTDVICEGDGGELLSLAYSLEAKSEHPLARAVVEYAQKNGTPLLETADFSVIGGLGVTATLNGEKITGGSLRLISDSTNVTDGIKKKTEELAEDGKTPLLFARGKSIVGIIAVADAVHPDSREAISQLSKMKISTVMLTGDNEKTARAVANQIGIERVIAGVLPTEKQNVIKELMQDSHVAMVGDGINDSPALTAANVGIVIGAGADIAIDSADVVLMKSTPSDVQNAVRLSRATLTNIRENLFWAFIYNAVGIPLAAGAWIPLTGWMLTPMFGALAMSLSSVSVVLNALRLNLFKINRGTSLTERSTAKTNPEALKDGDTPSNGDAHTVKSGCKADKNGIEAEKTKDKTEESTMKKTIKIEGMMCPHCSGRVRDVLSAIDGVADADVSHERGDAVVSLFADVTNEALTAAVVGAGYKVLGIE